MALVDWMGQAFFKIGISKLNPKMHLFLSARARGSSQIISNKIDEALTKLSDCDSVYWVHVASAGELEQVIPICQELSLRKPSHFIVSYFSPSAIDFVHKVPNTLVHFSLPFDRGTHFRILFKGLRECKKFKAVLFVRYEIWPAFFKSILDFDIPMLLVGAVARKTKTGFGGALSALVQNQFYKNFSAIFVSKKEDINFFKKLLPLDSKSTVVFSGDPKWTRAIQRSHSHTIKSSSAITEKDYFRHLVKKNSPLVIIFGSPHAAEQEVAFQLAVQIKENNDLQKNGVRIVCAPPETNVQTKQFWQTRAIEFGISLGCFSEFKTNSVISGFDLLLLDTMGDLADLYSVSDIAVIGGGFDGKLHNTLEPAAFGAAVLAGHKIQRAPEAEELLKLGALKVFYSTDELFQFLLSCCKVRSAESAKNHHSALSELNLLSSRAKLAFKDLPNTSEVICSHIVNLEIREVFEKSPDL
jgi:3-deoxy-D-manno-octulosonic-acid transferase